MSGFIKRLLWFFLIPISGLVILYFVSDPYRTLKPFSLDYFDTTNRDYLSSELFITNYPAYHYDSFIFGSSRGCGINTYHWAKYLPEGSKQFLFQAWNETLTGIEQKISYIDSHGYELNNALVLLDIPGSFQDKQLPTEALAIKDPMISLQPRWKYQMFLLYNFVQKPSQWIKAVRSITNKSTPNITFDTVSNDWDINNQYADLSVAPAKDSLCDLSNKAKTDFLHDLDLSDDAISTSEPLINDKLKVQLEHIREIFGRNQTDYRIVITPGFCYSFSSISPLDLTILESVFGKNRVFDYSSKNELNSDFNNYTDPNHFGSYVGWHIIDGIYNKKNPSPAL